MSDTTTQEAPVAKAMPTASRDLSVIHQGNAAVPMPTNFEQMERFAQLMARGTNMVGAAFRENPGACLGALIQAMRWGMDPYSCSQKMYIASKSGEGPIAYEAQLIHAVILKNAPLAKRPRCTYSGEGLELRCHVTFIVNGEDEPLTYDSPPLKKVKKNSPLWVDDPEQQLWYYSVRAGARRHFPDVIMGVYAPEELDEVVAKQAVEAQVVTLSGGGAVNAASEGEKPIEAEFSDGTASLARTSKKKPASAGAKAGSKAEGATQATTPEVVEAETKPAAAAQPNEPETDEDDGEESDEQLVTRIEAEVKAAKGAGRSKPIRDNKGALRALVANSDDEALAKRADALLNMFELED